MASANDGRFAGIQIPPISFVDEGVGPLLDLLGERFGINVLTVGTLSWIGMLVGRRASWKLEGFADHGGQEPLALKGGSVIDFRDAFYGLPADRVTRLAVNPPKKKSARSGILSPSEASTGTQVRPGTRKVAQQW